MLTLTQIDAIRNNLNEYVKSELDGIIPQKINTIFQILEEGNNNNLSEILPVRDANAADFESKVIITSQELEGDISTIRDSDYEEESNTEASEDSDDKYNFVEHTSECS